MRLVFISLVVVNVFVAIWGLFLHAPESADPVPGASAAQKKVEPVSLVPDVTARPDSTPAQSSPASTSKEGRCESVGPFDSTEQASDFSERLASIGVNSRVEQVELNVGESYWVHLPPAATLDRAAQKLRELQTQGIDSYLIRSGELENAISLGVFTMKPLAERRLKVLVEDGYDARIRVVPRTQIEIWVYIPLAEADGMGELSWQKMLEGLPQQERRQIFCLPVAS